MSTVDPTASHDETMARVGPRLQEWLEAAGGLAAEISALDARLRDARERVDASVRDAETRLAPLRAAAEGSARDVLHEAESLGEELNAFSAFLSEAQAALEAESAHLVERLSALAGSVAAQLQQAETRWQEASGLLDAVRSASADSRLRVDAAASATAAQLGDLQAEVRREDQKTAEAVAGMRLSLQQARGTMQGASQDFAGRARQVSGDLELDLHQLASGSIGATARDLESAVRRNVEDELRRLADSATDRAGTQLRDLLQALRRDAESMRSLRANIVPLLQDLSSLVPDLHGTARHAQASVEHRMQQHQQEQELA